MLSRVPATCTDSGESGRVAPVLGTAGTAVPGVLTTTDSSDIELLPNVAVETENPDGIPVPSDVADPEDILPNLELLRLITCEKAQCVQIGGKTNMVFTK